jgi:GH43 family beta-xylosidase
MLPVPTTHSKLKYTGKQFYVRVALISLAVVVLSTIVILLIKFTSNAGDSSTAVATVYPTPSGMVSPSGDTFANPVGQVTPDPSIVYYEGMYYMMYTPPGVNTLSIKMAASLAGMLDAESTPVWTAPSAATTQSGTSLPIYEIWAPEINYVFGGWYIYFTGSPVSGEDWHRVYVLQSSAGPAGPYTFYGVVNTNDGIAADTSTGQPAGMWAIDPSLFTTADGVTWLLWAGNPFGPDNTQRNEKICLMPLSGPITPLTSATTPTVISQPDYSWERNNGQPQSTLYWVTEGPSGIVFGNNVYIAYAASFCSTPEYAIGLVYATIPEGVSSVDALCVSPYNTADYDTTYTYAMQPAGTSVWLKNPEPILSANDNAGMYGIGGGEFFYSPDETQIWYIFHYTFDAEGNCGNDRNAAVLQVKLVNQDGNVAPALVNMGGEPQPLSTVMLLPSGDVGLVS